MAFNGTNNGGVIIEVGNWKGQSYSGVKVEKNKWNDVIERQSACGDNDSDTTKDNRIM